MYQAVRQREYAEQGRGQRDAEGVEQPVGHPPLRAFQATIGVELGIPSRRRQPHDSPGLGCGTRVGEAHGGQASNRGLAGGDQRRSGGMPSLGWRAAMRALRPDSAARTVATSALVGSKPSPPPSRPARSAHATDAVAKAT